MNGKINSRFNILVLLFLSGIIFFSSPAGALETNPDYLLDMDIEDLMAVEVSSVSKFTQPLLETPAAITVIDNEDIKRSGFKEMAEVMRLAPGMQVLRENEAYYHISARSIPFDGKRKMLVMSDGRSIFSQDTGTVNWLAQSFILEDIEKIEIIRGPGGTAWGYNAVDGVVNITSKTLEQTQGVLADVTSGTEGQTLFQTRVGGKFSKHSFFKVYLSGSRQDRFDDQGESGISEDLKKVNGGFRMDFHTSDTDLVSLEAAMAGTTYDQTFGYTDTYDEKFVKGEWTHSMGGNAQAKLLAHFDDSKTVYGETGTEKAFAIGIRQFNTDAQTDFKIGEKHHLIAGAGFKYTEFTSTDGYSIDFDDSGDKWGNCNFFLSDEYAVIEDRLWLTLGSKVEYNTITDAAWQPSVRILFKPRPDQSVWLAASRALRAPDFRDGATRTVTSIYSDGSGGSVTVTDRYIGSPLEDEKMLSYEAGYRFQVSKTLSSEIALFYNDYDNVLSKEVTALGQDSWLFSNSYDNSLTTYGTEVAVTWKPRDIWSLSASYAYLFNDYTFSGDSTDEHSQISRFQINSHIDATDRIGIDTHIFWNNSAAYFNTEIPEYLRLDLGVTYRATDKIELSLVGQNLLDPGHLEVKSNYTGGHEVEIPRNIQFTMKVKF